jgi:septal ring factor EnvC (AmiA/AmiB activator)
MRTETELLEEVIADLRAEVKRLKQDPRTHVCTERMLREERDKLRRDLDRKDHEVAGLKDDLEAADRAAAFWQREAQRLSDKVAELRAAHEALLATHREAAREHQRVWEEKERLRAEVNNGPVR